MEARITTTPEPVHPAGAPRVNYRNDGRAPLLFIAGGRDHIVPPAVNRANARKYDGSAAVTDYREYANRTHHTVGQDGWEAVADDALEWATGHAPAITAAPGSARDHLAGAVRHAAEDTLARLVPTAGPAAPGAAAGTSRARRLSRGGRHDSPP